MKEYVERKVAEQAKPEFLNEKVESYEKAIYAKGWNDCNTQYRENILSIPAADVVEVKHGRWIGEAVPDFDLCGVKYFHCSKCGWAEQVDYYNYCPDCGAKMDGGADK